MAQSGFTPIQLYRSATPGAVPLAADLAAGELALNTADEKLFFENASGSVVSIDAANGTVTSVALSGGTTGLTVSGSPITTSGTITLAGTLAVANGGTGVTSSTGTVAVVLSNSPTLVTPILGAATATSIANGLGAVGTPAYTFTGDLNTGVWSPAADTVAVSTAGSERMRIDSAGDVGIGTTNPLFPLEVNGEVRAANFTTSSGSQSQAASIASTLLTLSGITIRNYMVTVGISGYEISACSLIITGGNGSGGIQMREVELTTSAQISISISGGDINVTQTTGATQTIFWSITRLM
jgi:hypothetical protein